MEISQQEYREWATLPATQAFVNSLKQAREDCKEAWAREGYVAETAEASSLANAKALGGISAIDQTLELINSYKED